MEQNKNNTCNCGCKDEKYEKLVQVIEKYKDVDGGLIPVLHETQELYGYLPEYILKDISEKLNIPLAEIYGVATFYSRFTLSPSGKYQISVCLGTACYVKGSDKVLQKIKDTFKIDVGQCTPDMKFSLVATRCVGACGLAPVMTVNNDVYGKVTPDQVIDILKKYE